MSAIQILQMLYIVQQLHNAFRCAHTHAYTCVSMHLCMFPCISLHIRAQPSPAPYNAPLSGGWAGGRDIKWTPPWTLNPNPPRADSLTTYGRPLALRRSVPPSLWVPSRSICRTYHKGCASVTWCWFRSFFRSRKKSPRKKREPPKDPPLM